MKMKDLIVPLLLAFTTTMLLQYFVGDRFKQSSTSEQVASGEHFSAPTKEQTHRPLNTEIDFIDTKPHRQQELTTIKTDLMTLTFSNDGAALVKAVFQPDPGDIARRLETLAVPGNEIRERRCLLVAMGDTTPFYYDLIHQKEDKDSATLVYRAQTDQAAVVKTFVVHKDTYQIDLKLDIEPKAGVDPEEIRPRIVLVSPYLSELTGNQMVAGLVNKGPEKLQKITSESEIKTGYWFAPTLFGVENKYFVLSLVQDDAKFAERGYFEQDGKNDLTGFIEGSKVKEDGSWELSFYYGPKELQACIAVDPRLEGVLDYGFFGSLSKIMLYLLKKLYSYTHNYGFAILLLTLLIKLLMLPLTFNADLHMKRQKDVQKKLKYVEQKYRHDPQALAREKAEVMRKHGLPGMVGCLPQLLQIPVFLSLRAVLASAIELYKAPFMFWITDLSIPDPYYILPAVFVLAMIGQTLTTATDPKQMLSAVLMALFVGAIFLTLPAGLTLYFAANMVLTALQTTFSQWWRKRKVNNNGVVING